MRQGPFFPGGRARFFLPAKRRETGQAVFTRVFKNYYHSNIPHNRNSENQRGYDKGIHRVHHMAENAFLHLGQWRGLAARDAKAPASFVADVQNQHCPVVESVSMNLRGHRLEHVLQLDAAYVNHAEDLDGQGHMACPPDGGRKRHIQAKSGRHAPSPGDLSVGAAVGRRPTHGRRQHFMCPCDVASRS